MTTKLYLNGLDCPSCAQKIEDRIAKMPNVSDVSVNFSTATLKLTMEDEYEQEILKKVRAVVTRVEPDVTVEEVGGKANKIVKASQTCSDSSCAVQKHSHNVDEHNHVHSHADEHSRSSGDGHSEHMHEHGSSKSVKIQLILSAIIAVIAIVLSKAVSGIPNLVIMLLYASAVLICGHKVVKQGIRNLFRLEFEENFLMTIAIVAAFIIGEYMEAALVMILFVLGSYIEDLAVAKSRRDISNLTNIRPDTANLFTENGSARSVMAEEVNIGDVILIKAGDRVPLDCEIIEGNSAIDNSAMTGESVPITVNLGDELMSGAVNLSGLLKCRVTKTFENSAASRIVELVEQSVEKKGNTENFIRKFARIYTPIIMILSVVFAIVPPLLGLGSFTLWVNRSLVFLVSSCPCAFVIAVPLGMYSAIGANSKAGVLVKGGKYIEALSETDTVVLDKTGTLTTGELGVEKVVTHSQNRSEQDILRLCAMLEQHSNHPIARSIVDYYGKEDSSANISDYIETAGMGIAAKVDGNDYLCGSEKMMHKNGIATEEYAPSNIYLAENDILIGQIFIADKIKESSKTFVKKLAELRVNRVVMLTGDSKPAAESVAEACGITEYKYGLLPEDKVREFEEIKSSDGTCLFVGDGINDAPVLAMADVGISVGLGSDIAIEASDVVLMSGDLKDLVNAVAISKKSMRTIRFLIVLALGIKFAVQILGVLGTLGSAAMGLAVFADVGVSIISIIIATRIMNYYKKV